MARTRAGSREPKYQKICDWILDGINRGEYQEGQRLPSEVQLVKQFGVSRPTVGRAISELEQKGLVETRAGSGTYVRKDKVESRYVFGLLVPELGQTEIFEPICQGIAQASHSAPHELLWGQTQRHHSNDVQAQHLCDQYIARGVSGVFFAPVELTEGKDEVNRRIVEALDKAGIPIILLDRDICAYPQRSRYDLVGVDNHRAGYAITEHLLKLGYRRIVFFARPNSAPTVDERFRGYREALFSFGVPCDPEGAQWGDCDDAALIRRILDDLRPEAFVCANDITAARLMQTLSSLGVQIPTDVRIVGIDDVKYASLLRVPLTTLHQPCQEIGAEALMAMFERIDHPNMPARHIMLDCKLIVRQSCGASLCSGK
jgi:DNA-binding LacI/PurR family transcriptional regulator